MSSDKRPFENQYTVEEIHLGKTHKVHHVKITDTREKAAYAAETSIQAFRRRERERAFGKKANKDPYHYCNTLAIRFDIRSREDWEIYQSALNKLSIKQPDVVEHDSLWKFYDYIGYDYKSNKFTK